MQQLFETWWYGYLIIPIAITLFIGSILAVLTGVIIARFVAFDQLRMSFCKALYNLSLLSHAKTRQELLDKRFSVIAELNALNFEAFRLRQNEMFSTILYIATQVRKAPWTDPNENDFPLSREVRKDLHARVSLWSRTWAAMVFELKPSYYSLITLKSQVGLHEKLAASNLMKIVEKEEKTYKRLVEKNAKAKG